MVNKYLSELLEKHNIEVSDDNEENIKKWNDLVDSSDVESFSNEEVILESNYLKTELIKHKPVNIFEMLSLIPVLDYSDKILFYNGDIASMFIDAIAVPAAADTGDRGDKQHCVYYYNGINLRKKLNIYTQDKPINDSEVVITRSYNVPCDYILHVNYDYKDISTTIINILECCRVNMIKSVLIDIDMNDLEMYKTVYDSVCKYLDKYKVLFDKIIIYVNPAIEVRELEKELS